MVLSNLLVSDQERRAARRSSALGFLGVPISASAPGHSHLLISHGPPDPMRFVTPGRDDA